MYTKRNLDKVKKITKRVEMGLKQLIGRASTVFDAFLVVIESQFDLCVYSCFPDSSLKRKLGLECHCHGRYWEDLIGNLRRCWDLW